MNVSERAKEKLDTASKEVREAVEGLKHEVAALSNKVRERLKGSGTELRESADDLTREVKTLSERVRDLLPGRRRYAVPVKIDRSTRLPADVTNHPFEGTWRISDLLFDDFFRTTGWLPSEWGLTHHWTPARFAGEGFRADLSETDDELHLSAELPGIDKDDLSVSVSGWIITIQGEKRSEEKRKDLNYYSVERSYGMFKRSFRLPTEVEPEKTEASFKNGVLTVRLPKSEAARKRKRKIRIRSG